MKKNKKESVIQQDIEFIRSKINNDETEIPVPMAVQRDVIVTRLEGAKQKTSSKVIVRRVVACALSLALIIGGVFIGDKAVYREMKLPTDTIAVAGSYYEVLSLVKDYRDSQNFSFSSFSFGMSDKYATATADESVMAPDMSPETAVNAGYQGASDDSDSSDRYSELNTREEGVAEADYVLTNGKYIFIASMQYGRVVIVNPVSDGKMTIAATINPAEDNEKLSSFNFSEMFLYGDKLILTGSGWADDSSRTVAMVYDISDIGNIRLVKTLSQSGWYTTLRVIGDKMLLISEYSIPFSDECDMDDVIPTYTCDGEEAYVPADCILYADVSAPEAYNIITTCNLSDLSASTETQAILGSDWQVYCTTDMLFIYGSTYNEKEECCYMNVKAFRIGETSLEYYGCCSFEGSFWNSFSMDWNGEYLRVGVHSDKDNTNRLYIFDKAFEKVGEINSFGEGETIRGIRFVGNTAYIVTFYQTDPLFIVDLSDVTAPKIVSELKMPGFSDYLHPVGDGLMLGIGSGGDENGLDGSAKISLYDVSDPLSPLIVSDIIIPNGTLWTEYKAFCKVPGENSFIIPAELWGAATDDSTETYTYEYSYSCGAVMVTLTEDNTLVKTGEFFVSDPVGYENISRAVVVGDTVYGVDAGKSVHAWAMNGTKLDSLYFTEGWEIDNGYYYIEDYVYDYAEDYADDNADDSEITPAYNPGDAAATEAPTAAAPSDTVEFTYAER